MQHPGEVFFLPPDLRKDGDSTGRRHVLLVECDENSAMSTFAFASRQSTEARHGAQHVLVDPAATMYRRTGFDYPTYVYPSRIVGAHPKDLLESEGRILDEMPLIRAALAKALGFGTGTSDSRGEAVDSWRGRIVRLIPPLAEELGTLWAVIISEPTYSKTQRFQNVVPILPGPTFERAPLDVPLHEDTTAWLGPLQPGLAESFLWIEGVFALFHASEIDAYTSACVDATTVRELENALALYFHL